MSTVYSDMSNLFKQVFGDGVVEAIPDFAKILKMVPFSERERTGNYFEIPVVLELEQGFTYQAYGTQLPTLNAAVGGNVSQAQVNGAIIILRSQIGYDQLYRASQKGPQAFKDALSMLYENMVSSMARRVEIGFILGGSGLGKVSSITSHVITFTTATWSPGVWSGMIGATLDSFTATSGGSAHDAGLVVTGIDMTNMTVTVTGDSTTVANDYIFFGGARGAECVGLIAQLTNTGTLFNISASSHPLWAGQQYNVAGAISQASINQAVALAVNGGLMEEAVLFIAPARWSTLLNDQAALRRYDNSNEAENGAEEIVFYNSNGKIKVVSHPIMPLGVALLIPNPEKRLLRVGSSDITFRRPGRENEDLFLEIPNTGGVELRLFSDAQLFLPTPAQACYLYGITA